MLCKKKTEISATRLLVSQLYCWTPCFVIFFYVFAESIFSLIWLWFQTFFHFPNVAARQFRFLFSPSLSPCSMLDELVDFFCLSHAVVGKFFSCFYYSVSIHLIFIWNLKPHLKRLHKDNSMEKVNIGRFGFNFNDSMTIICSEITKLGWWFNIKRNSIPLRRCLGIQNHYITEETRIHFKCW